jgi:predicted transcriptional regulator
VGSLIKRNNISIGTNNSLRAAVEMMAKENIDLLPIISDENKITGILSYKDILSAYKRDIENDDDSKNPSISLKRNGLKILVRGNKLINLISRKG